MSSFFALDRNDITLLIMPIRSSYSSSILAVNYNTKKDPLLLNVCSLLDRQVSLHLVGSSISQNSPFIYH